MRRRWPSPIVLAVVLAGIAALVFIGWRMRAPDPTRWPRIAKGDAAEQEDDAPIAAYTATSPRAPIATAAPTHHAPPLSSGTSVDREQREKMRDAIWRAFGRPPPPTTTGNSIAGSAPPLGEPAGDAGTLSPAYIRERVRGDFFPLAGGCYGDALKKDPTLRGRLVVHFVIVGDQKIGGIVESVQVKDESTLKDPELLECMRESLLSVTFKPPENGGWVSVTYPIEFSPEDDDGGSVGDGG